jgi:hypothetical protein
MLMCVARAALGVAMVPIAREPYRRRPPPGETLRGRRSKGSQIFSSEVPDPFSGPSLEALYRLPTSGIHIPTPTPPSGPPVVPHRGRGWVDDVQGCVKGGLVNWRARRRPPWADTALAGKDGVLARQASPLPSAYPKWLIINITIMQRIDCAGPLGGMDA